MRNTSQVGEVATAQILASLVKLGKQVLIPFGDSKRYDLVIEEEGGRFLRIQCKNGRVTNGAMIFHACSVDSRSEPGKCIRRRYQGEVEFFGVFCPDNGKCYLVPIDIVTGYYCSLRVEPPRNNQQKGIRWARDYEIGNSPEIESHSGLSVYGEVAIIEVE